MQINSQVNTGTIDVKEKVGYIAIESGVSGTFVDSGGNSIAYETQITPENIQGWGTGCFENSFLNTYASKPKVMASLQTRNGGDGGWLRRCSLNKTALGLTVDEDKFGDAERRHNNAEGAGIVAFSDAFEAQFADENGTWGMEIAKVVLPSTAVEPVFTSVTFRQTYATKPVVVVLPNKSGSNPASLRIRNVTKRGFEVVQVEPAPSDGTHASMPIHYLAIETGVHSLPDGTKIEVGRKATKKQQHGAGVVGEEGWATIKFSGGTPAVGVAQTFVYDPNGNRIGFTEQGVSYTNTYAPESNRLLSSTGPVAASYTYDANGNVLGDGSRTFSYDARDRLVALDGGSTTYEYNGLGERVRKTGSTDKIFLYARDASLIGEYDATGGALQEFVYFGSVPVAVTDAAGVKLIHTDHLGTPREITSNGVTVWRWESDPFGATAVQQDPDGDGTGLTIGLRFPGQYYDSESGLHYNFYRTYDPLTGRYLESDPIGLLGGSNTYGYVNSDPLSFVDPKGLVKWNGTLRIDVIGYGKRVPVGKRRFPLGFELATIVKFELESECKCGKKVTVNYNVEGIETGFFMLPTMAVRAKLQMEDDLPCPDGWNFGGRANLDVGVLGIRAKGFFDAGTGTGTFRGWGFGLGDFESEGISNIDLRNRPRVEECCESD